MPIVCVRVLRPFGRGPVPGCGHCCRRTPALRVLAVCLPHHLVVVVAGAGVTERSPFFLRGYPAEVEVQHLVSTQCSSRGSGDRMSLYSSLVSTFTLRISARTVSVVVSSPTLRESWTHISWENNVLGVWEGASRKLQGSAKKGNWGSPSHPWRYPTRQIPGGMECEERARLSVLPVT